MSLDPDLLAVLACPDCHAAVTERPTRPDPEGGQAADAPPAAAELVCTGCGLAYPVRDEIPVMLVDEARRRTPPEPESPAEESGAAGEPRPSHEPRPPEGPRPAEGH